MQGPRFIAVRCHGKVVGAVYVLTDPPVTLNRGRYHFQKSASDAFRAPVCSALRQFGRGVATEERNMPFDRLKTGFNYEACHWWNSAGSRTGRRAMTASDFRYRVRHQACLTREQVWAREALLESLARQLRIYPTLATKRVSDGWTFGCFLRHYQRSKWGLCLISQASVAGVQVRLK